MFFRTDLALERRDIYRKANNLEDEIPGIKYNVENGRVDITIENTEKFVSLCVKDTGIGIPEKYQDRIFERFFRVDKSRSKATGGTGLGLAIVKHTAEYLGGSVKLESRENEGTAITVLLAK